MYWMLLPFRRFTDYRGRSRRTEFWLFAIFVVLGSMMTTLADTVLGLGGGFDTQIESGPWNFRIGTGLQGGVLNTIWWIAALIPAIPVAIRRLQDGNHRAWWLLLILIPIPGWIVLAVFFFEASWPTENRWGEVPPGADAGPAKIKTKGQNGMPSN